MDLRDVVKKYSQGSYQLKTTELVFYNVIQISILLFCYNFARKNSQLNWRNTFLFFNDENMLIEYASNSQDRFISRLAYSEIFFVLLRNSCFLADEPAC